MENLKQVIEQLQKIDAKQEKFNFDKAKRKYFDENHYDNVRDILSDLNGHGVEIEIDDNNDAIFEAAYSDMSETIDRAFKRYADDQLHNYGIDLYSCEDVIDSLRNLEREYRTFRRFASNVAQFIGKNS